MTSNPFYNALFALAYIMTLVSFVLLGPFQGPDVGIFRPMAWLSMLVLSVALMAYLFFYQPVVLLLDGKREKAVKLFLQTIAIFACGIVAVLFISVFVKA